jgi:BCD family chlorophyll transporter-like MFS transporter
MYVMLLLGMIVSALAFGAALAEFSPGRLVKVIQSAALLTMVLNVIAVWKQEPRCRERGAMAPRPDPSFRDSWLQFLSGGNAVRRLTIVGLGTMAFGMADILLEPFGGHVLHLSVSATTKLTALFAIGGLFGFAVASRVIAAGADPYITARRGALIGVPAFVLVMAAAPLGQPLLFLVGNFLIGFGGALFGHGTLTATMNQAPREQVGLALGAWGAVQATAAGVGMALSGAIRDLVNVLTAGAEPNAAAASSATGYMTVYGIEIALLLVTIFVTAPLIRRAIRSKQRDGLDSREAPVPVPIQVTTAPR